MIISQLFSRRNKTIIIKSTQSTHPPKKTAGSSVTKIRLHEKDGWQIQLADVKAAIREDTKYLVLNEPFNPTGRLMTPELQRELRDLAEAHGIVILCDEVVSYQLIL